MRNPILNFLLGVLSAIVFLYGLNHFGFSPFFESPVTVNVISEVASPNAEFMATTNRASNKNGWCEERTNIHKKDEGFDWEREDIFNIDCGSEIEFKWEDNSNLVITYSYNDAGVVGTSQQFVSKNKEVNISYFLKQ